jgi:hypothetical protein
MGIRGQKMGVGPPWGLGLPGKQLSAGLAKRETPLLLLQGLH